MSDLSVADGDLSDVIYDILNRTKFTRLFNVSSDSLYINPAIDFPVDVSEYNDSTVFECLEDLAKGLNIFYVDPKNNFFYFKEIEETNYTVYQFLESNERKIDLYKFKEGTDRVYNSLTWSGEPTITASDSSAIRIIPINDFNIKGLVNSTYRQLVIDAIFLRQKVKRQYFRIKTPYAPFFRLLDKINVQSSGQAPENAPRWGFVNWNNFQWASVSGIKIPISLNWIIREIKHSGLVTELECEIIL